MALLDLPDYTVQDNAPAPAAVPPRPPPSNAFVSGLKSGAAGVGAAGFGALSGLATLGGWQQGAQNYAAKAASFQQDAEDAGRPDIDKAGWTGGGLPGFFSKAAYTAGQMIPGAAGVIGGAVVGGALLPEEAAVGGLGGAAMLASRVGAALPEFLGGDAAATVGTQAAARAGAGILGGAAVAIPQSFGEQVNAAQEQQPGVPLGRGMVARAALQSIPAGLAQAIVPAEATGARAAEVGLAHHITTNAAVAAVGSGLQTAADDSFNPNLSPADRAKNVLNAVATGAFTGGLIGGVSGMIFGRQSAPEQQTTVDAGLRAAGLDPENPSEPPVPPAPSPVPGAQNPDVAGPPERQGAPDLREPKQLELPLQRPVQTLAPETQLGFDVTPQQLDLPNAPADLGTAPPAPTDDDRLAQINALRASRGKDPLPPSQADLFRGAAGQDDAAPDNQFTKSAVAELPPTLKAEARRNGPFKEFIAQSQAKDFADLYQEIQAQSAVGTDAKVTDSPAFQKLSKILGVGEDRPALVAERQALVDAKAPAKEIGAVDLKLGIYDEIARREAAAAALADASSARTPPADAGAAPRGLIQAEAAPDDLNIPELSGPDQATAPAVPRDGDAKDAAERASTTIQTLGPEVTAPLPPEATPEPGSERAPASGGDRPSTPDAGVTPSEPLSISDRVIAAARDAVGNKGGEVDIGSLRAALPDISTKDFENALREIHTDDSDNTLTANPKGQRTGVDGVSVPGSGRFHKLDVEPREDPADAAQVGSAAPQAGDDQPGSPAPAGGGDAPGPEAAGAGQAQEVAPEVGPPGAPQPAGQGDASPAQAVAAAGPPIATPQVVATNAKLSPLDATENKSPAQQTQDLRKVTSAANILAAPEAVKSSPAGQTAVKSLRKQTRAKTAMIETPNGDQLPTATVGGEPQDLAQTTATSVDPILPAGPPEPMIKQLWDRQPGITETAGSLGHEMVEGEVYRLKNKLRPEVQDRIHVISDESGFPPEVRAAAAASGDDLSKVPALYHNGEVFIRSDQMRNYGEVQDAFSHEVFGHLGTMKRFEGATDYQNGMSGIFNRMGGMKGIEKLAREAGVWSEAEDGKNLRGGAGLEAYFPKDGSKLSPHQMTRILDELIAHKAGVDAGPIEGVFAQIQTMAKKGIVNVLRRAGLADFAKRVDTFGQAELAKWVSDSRAALRAQPKPGDVDLAAGASSPRTFLHDSDPTGEPPYLKKISGQQRDSQGVMDTIASLRDRIYGPVRDNQLAQGLFGARDPMAELKARSTGEVARDAAQAFVDQTAPGKYFAQESRQHGMHLDHYFDLQEGEANTRFRLGQATSWGDQNHLNLKSAAPQKERNLNRLMLLETEHNVDHALSWDQHTWLPKTVDTPEARAQVAQARAAHAEAQQLYHGLAQPTAGERMINAQPIYEAQRAAGRFHYDLGEAAMMHRDLQDLGVKPPYDPVKRYGGLDPNFVDANGRPLTESLHNNIHTSAAYAEQAYRDMRAAYESHVQDAMMNPDNAGSQIYKDAVATLERAAEGRTAQLEQGPYFRLGRAGDYTVAAKIKGIEDADGTISKSADPAHLQAVVDYMKTAFPDISIGVSNQNRQLFVRFQSESRAQAFNKVISGSGPLARHFEEGTLRAAKISETNALDGTIPGLTRAVDQAAAGFNREIDQMAPGPARDNLVRSRDLYVGNLRAQIINLRGENSMASIRARRENVQGASSDMAENQRHAAYSRAADMSATSVRTEQAQIASQARARIEQIARSGDPDAVAKQAAAQRVYDGFMSRVEASQQRVDNTFLERAKGVMHSFALGMSPSYVIMNMSQLGTLSVPEFAKFHGFARTTAAMIKATPVAMRIIASMAKKFDDPNGGQSRGIQSGGISRAVLDDALGAENRAGSLRNWMSEGVNRGLYELGGYSHSQSGVAYGNLGKVGRFLHFANSVAMMAETTSRLITGIAAKDLHENMPAGPARDSMLRQYPTSQDYAGHVIKDSMMEWGSYNTPKFMTAGGVLGKAGPTVGQFHGWTPRLVEKLYREAYNGFTSRLGDSPEALQQKKEARSFIYAHLAAVTMISGALGLPFAGYAAGAATRLSGTFLDQPFDVEDAFREFMANTFGQDVGEIASRGLPRYLGTDLGDLGDNDFLPLARLMEDRRKFEDAFPDYLAHAWGGLPTAAANFVLGARDMSEGRPIEAMGRALPTSMRNIARAYRVANDGYLSPNGTPMPLQADAMAVLKTGLGVESGQLAEYREKQDAQRGLTDDRQYRTQLIKRNYVLAFRRGDQQGMTQAMDAAVKYDQDNPGQRFVQSLGDTIQQQQQNAAYARITGVLGVKPGDIAARNLGNY